MSIDDAPPDGKPVAGTAADETPGNVTLEWNEPKSWSMTDPTGGSSASTVGGACPWADGCRET